MVKNKAQIAWKSIKKKKPRASRALKQALDPCQKWVRFRAHNVHVGT